MASNFLIIRHVYKWQKFRCGLHYTDISFSHSRCFCVSTLNYPTLITNNYSRFLSTSRCLLDNRKNDIKKDSTVSQLVVTFRKVVKWQENFLERQSPSGFKLYMRAKMGAQYAFADFKVFFNSNYQVWRGKSLESLEYKELYLLYRTPDDMSRVGLPLLLALLPVLSYFVLPLAFLFPRRLLSRHFWSEKQKEEFYSLELGARLRKFAMPAGLDMLQVSNDLHDPEVRAHAVNLVKKVQNSEEISAESLIRIINLFPKGCALHVESLSKPHQRALCSLANLPKSILKLKFRITLLAAMDQKLRLDSLSSEELAEACYIRGLSAVNASAEQQRSFLRDWVAVSSAAVRISAHSIILHQFLLLSAFHPLNKPLMYSEELRIDS